MKLTIFDGRKSWVEANYTPSLSVLKTGGELDSLPDNRTEYLLRTYNIDVRHGILSIENIQRLVAISTNCYKGQVMVNDIRGGFVSVSIYVKHFGIALITNTLNNAFGDIQHEMVRDIMLNGISVDDYREIDLIFERNFKMIYGDKNETKRI